MPEPFDVEALAPRSARHREHVAGRVMLGQLGERDAAGEHDVLGTPCRSASVAQVALVASRPDQQQRRVRHRRAGSAGNASMRTSCPLRGTSRDTHTMTGRPASPYRARTAAAVKPGTERLDVDSRCELTQLADAGRTRCRAGCGCTRAM